MLYVDVKSYKAPSGHRIHKEIGCWRRTIQNKRGQWSGPGGKMQIRMQRRGATSQPDKDWPERPEGNQEIELSRQAREKRAAGRGGWSSAKCYR